MIGAQIALVAIVSGGIGGGIVACLLEVFLQRRAQEEVGYFDQVEVGPRITNR